MFRRSRFSIRPNVGTAGRTAATPQESPPADQEASETSKVISDNNTATTVTDSKLVLTPSERPTAQGDGSDQNGEGTSSSSAIQRRKRFSVKPKVAPGRPSALARTTKSPVKAVSEVPVSDQDKPTVTSQNATTVPPQGLQSPRQRRPSEESKQAKVQPKPTLIPSDSSGPSVVAIAEDSLKQIHPSADSGKQLQGTSDSQSKEAPFKLADKVPPALPDKHAFEISEKAKTLVSSKSGLSPTSAAFSLSRLLNDPSDIQRLAKARKLRELLRKELHKEKKIKKSKLRVKEFTLDPTKMTMRDLIRYLPVSNPMTLEDPAPENETVVPPSPGRHDSPERAQEPEVQPKVSAPGGEVEEEEEEEEEAAASAAAEEEQEEPFLVPQVKVAEDGSLIIDEESLTVEVQRAKGPNPAQDRDPIFERGSTTTYSSFRKGTYSKPWSSEETDMFFLAISMVGTDFSMICQLFPHRARSEIKNKFKKEERENVWRVDKAFRERHKLDIEYFSKLLEKILEAQKNRKKLKSLVEKNSPKKKKRKAQGKKPARKPSDVEEGEDSEIPDLEEEGEKENEELCNEGETPVSNPIKKCKRKKGQDTTSEEPNDKKNKTNEESSEQDEACIPEDTEAALPEDRTNSDKSDKTESLNASKDTTIKPAKLSRGRAPKPLVQLGRKRGKNPPSPSTKTKDSASDKGEESVNDGAAEEQVNEDASAIRQDSKKKSASDHISSEEEDPTVQTVRPTRYGRMPKPTKPLTYPAKEDTHSSAPEATPASPAGSSASATGRKPKCTAKRRSSKQQSVQESKKPKLVTLRASQTEYSDDEENEKQWVDDDMEEEQHSACGSSRDNSETAFVPASLRSPHPVIVEVEETMEELDILVNMPDMLGISQDALCPDVTCKLAQSETDPAEPCEHQLDLLVDVIDCLSSEYTVSEDESYNEAAQTLLTISNLALLSQSAQNQIAIQDPTTDTSLVIVDQTIQNLEQDFASKPSAEEDNSDTPLMPATSAKGFTIISETANVELQKNPEDDGAIILTTGQSTGHIPLSSPEKSEKNSSQTRRGPLPKMKPVPNLSQTSRTVQPKYQPEKSTETTPVESHTVAPNLYKATGIVLADEETSTNVECIHKCPADKISLTEVKLPEVAFGNQEMSVDQLTSGAATSEQSTSENQSHRLCDTKLEPSLEQTTRESTDKILTSVVMKSRSNYLVGSDTAVTELQPTQKSNPTQKSHEKPIMTVEVESTRIILPEKSQSCCPASDLMTMNADAGPTEELTTADEKKTDVGLIGHSSTASSDQGESTNKIVPEATTDTNPVFQSTEEEMYHVGAVETSVGPGSNTDSAPVQDSSYHSTGKSSICITHVKDLPVSQKEESECSPACPTRKTRFHKVKPKPNIALISRNMRTKPVTTKSPLKKSANQTPKPKIHEKIIVHEAEASCIPSPEKLSQSTGNDSELIPSFDVSSTVSPREEHSTSEDKKIDVGVVGQVESCTNHDSSENKNFSEALFELSREQATIERSPTSEITKEKVTSTEKVGPGSNIDSAQIQESSDCPASCIPHVEEIPISQKEDTELASTCQMRKGRKVEPKPNLLRTGQSQPQATKEKPSSPTSKHVSSNKSIAEMEAQPTCSKTLSEKPSQIQSTDTASLSVSLLELCSTHKPEEESSTEDQKIAVGCSEASTSEGAAKTIATGRRRLSRLKPNIGSSTRNILTKLQPNDCSQPSEVCHIGASSNVTSEKQLVKNNDAQTQPTEKEGEYLTSARELVDTELTSSAKLEPAESGKSENSPNHNDVTSDDVAIATSLVAQNWSVLTDSVVEINSRKNNVEGEATGGTVVAGLASQWDCKQDTPIRVTETNTQPTGDQTATSDVQSSGDGSTESQMKCADTQSIFDPKESIQQPCSKTASELKSQDSVQQSSEITRSKATASRSTHDNETETDNSSKSSKKAVPNRRSRLVKPKPNVGHRSRPQQIQNITQAEADSVTRSEHVDVLISHKPVPEGKLDVQKPEEGAIEQHGNQNPPLINADSSLGCLTQVIEQQSQCDSPLNVVGPSLGCVMQRADNYIPDGSTSSTDGNQNQPNLTMFSDVLPQQVPSYPDEPFFILSLTEIPVCSLGEVVGRTPEPLPALPVADVSVHQHQIDSGEALAAGPPQDVAVSTEQIAEETGLTSVKDGPSSAPYTGSVMENTASVDQHEITPVQPSTLPETVENNEKTEPPPTKLRQRGTQRTAPKLQVKAKTQRKTLAGKAKETESVPTQITEDLGPSVEPKALDDVVTESKRGSGDHVNIGTETLVGGTDPEDGSSVTQTRKTNGRRKPKGSTPSSGTNTTAPLSESPPSKAASRGPKVKSPCTAGKLSLVPVASTSCDVTAAPTQTRPLEEPAETDTVQSSNYSQLFSALPRSTSPHTAELSAFQQSDNVEVSAVQEEEEEEEEPTSVCQYFLSDIFTEVEEG